MFRYRVAAGQCQADFVDAVQHAMFVEGIGSELKPVLKRRG